MVDYQRNRCENVPQKKNPESRSNHHRQQHQDHSGEKPKMIHRNHFRMLDLIRSWIYPLRSIPYREVNLNF